MNDRSAHAVVPHPPLSPYYKGEQERPGFVSRIFDRTAGDYERVERWMAVGTGAWYRRKALLRAGLSPGHRVLDVAAGTGLVSRAAAEIVGAEGLVVALDPSEGMLRQAAGRPPEQNAPPRGPIRFLRGVAERLPFEDASFDFLSMGYALRHVGDLSVMFPEFRRVLRPGGTACILEITRPARPMALTLMRWYMRGVVPMVSRLTRRSDGQSPLLWQYYWDTIEACVPPQQVMDAMSAAGFVDVRRHLEVGVFSEYTAKRPL